MGDMATLGFITAGMTIIGLLRVLFAFREIRSEMHGQRLELIEANNQIGILTSSLARGSSFGRRILDLEMRAQVDDRTAKVASYEEAARMVQRGVSQGELTTSCGLSRGEAQLVKTLWGAEARVVHSESTELR